MWKSKTEQQLMEISNSLALSMPMSNRGDCIAFNAASIARFFPTNQHKVIAIHFVHITSFEHANKMQ